MATIAQLPFSPFHYRKPLLYSHHQQSRIFVSYLNLTKKKKNCFVCFACSIKQIRVRKRVKSNEELRSEIMEFVALNGFPQGHVPSMKELSAHGRVDLANVVRRRGYKFIRELLANSEIEDCCNELVSEENTKIEASASDISLEDSLTEGQGEEAALDVVERNLSSERPSSTEIDLSAVDDSMPLDPKINNISEEGVIVNSSPEAEEYGSVSNEESSLAGVSSMGSSLANFGDSNYSGEVRENTLKVEILELSNRADIENSFSEKFTSTELSLTAIDGSMPLDQKINCFPEEGGFETSSPEAEECGSVSRDESSLAGVSSMGNSLANLEDSNYSGEITENNLKIESVEFNNRADIECSSSEASVSAYQSLLLDDTSSYSDREADNVLMTEDVKLNAVEEDLSLNRDHYTSPDLNYTNHFDIDTESISTENFQNLQIDDMSENRFGKNSMLEPSSSTSSIEEKTTRFIQNGYLDTVDDNENDIPNESSAEETKESAEASKGGNSYGGQRSLSTPPNGSALALEEITDATEVNSSDRNIDQRDGRGDLDKDPHDETMKRENQVEITRLRFMLLQKEQELSRLKEQIEKEKLSLSVLQRQAETEIQKAQMLVSEKDVELQEAEESLSGLQEVEIEYCGDGNVVEVTGSFNGWEHRVGLELQASKSIGKQKCWSTLLWLYPGTYEIKFIVDGQWTTDPRQESVTRGHITNNILKVKS